MKAIRIGCGSGGCAFERIEPAVELLEKGRLDYLIFECLAERTIANAQKEKQRDPSKGYNPMLEVRMRRLLPLAVDRGVKIVSNMGAANTPGAVAAILEIARELGLQGLKVAMVRGDDILDRIGEYQDSALWDRKIPLRQLDGHIVAANAYLSGDPIREALDAGADMVITGRVADPALFVGPLKHEFGWTAAHPEKLGQALLLGHLMECGSQITGGYYADPGYKDVEDLHILGFPIAEIDESGVFAISKVDGSGGRIDLGVCKEQLLYEITDPGHYITPDGIADFSAVTFEQTGRNRVTAKHATCKGEPQSYKVNIGYQDCWVGEACISFGGANALNRARLAAEIVEKRLRLIGVVPDEYRVEYIGYDSLYRESISSAISAGGHGEIRLCIAARTRNRDEAVAVTREVECLYINGPAGGGGIRSGVEQITSIDNILIPRQDIVPTVVYFEV